MKVTRTSQPSFSLDGFVVALGTKWVVLQRMMDGGFFDGHVAVRLSDIKKVVTDTSFEAGFASTQDEWPPALPETVETLDLNSTAGMLIGLLRPDRLVGIERKKPSDAIWIGVPYAVERATLFLWEAKPDATWHDQPYGYAFSSITTVVLNDHYQRGLTAMLPELPAAAVE